LCVLISGLFGIPGRRPVPARAQSLNYLHTQGNQIVDANGNQVILTGINWFGLETESYAPHGLWARSWQSILDQIVELGFNTIRLPYSNQLFDASSVPNGINYELNPDLKGLSGSEVMDKIIAGAGERGLKVILDRHRPDSHSQSELWYTPEYSEERWISDWVMLAKRYLGSDTVIGMDLHNEPHGRATWGSDDPATDWRLAAERAGNAILKVNPHLLILVQGVEQFQGDWYWWGGNLMGAREYPIRLDVPDQLVYSTHVYGPGVYPQPWFSDPTFPNNMPEIWDRHWGYLIREGIAPVVTGEFGGRSVGEDKEGVWQRTLVDYMRKNQVSYFYWTLNPNSGDTGGILLDDWQSVDPKKEALLSGYQFPLIGIEQRGQAPATELAPPASATQLAPPAPTTQLALPTPQATQPAPEVNVAVGTLQVRYRTANSAAQTRDSKPEFVLVNTGSSPVPLDRVELHYWLSVSGEQPFQFHCDWAQISCANVVGEFQISESGSQYLRVRFSPQAGTLATNQDSGEIKLRFNRADWSEYSQTEDYSFSPVTDYIDWQQVTLYVDGRLVWGVEPGSAPAPTAGGAIAPPDVTLSPALSVPSETPSPITPEPSGTPPPAGPVVTSASTYPPVSSEGLPGGIWGELALLGWLVALGLGFFILRNARSSRLRKDKASSSPKSGRGA